MPAGSGKLVAVRNGLAVIKLGPDAAATLQERIGSDATILVPPSIDDLTLHLCPLASCPLEERNEETHPT